MLKIAVEITGTSPLLMHNERLSDPADKIVREIKSITDKGADQTEKDREMVSKLEWHGALYEDETGRIVIPAKNVIRCFREAGAVTKDGKKIASALSPGALNFPLIYDGPKKKDDLWANPVFTDRRQVKIQRGRISRTRPCFPKWGLVASFVLIEEMMSFAKLQNVAGLAGMATGLCDGRIIGYGRFNCKITKS